MTTDELTCEKDRAATRLTCAQCAAPICPQCMMRTPVGLKCLTCGVLKGGSSSPGAGRAAWVVPAMIVLILLAVIGLPRLFSRSDGPLDEDVGFSPDAEGPARFAMLGEEAKDADLAFMVSDFECGATQVGEGATARTAQGRFCFLTLSLRNTGRSPVPFFAPGQALVDGQERRFGVDGRATAAHPANAGGDPTAALINPSNELSGVLVFDIPPDVHPVYANLLAVPRGGSGGAYIRLQART